MVNIVEGIELKPCRSHGDDTRLALLARAHARTHAHFTLLTHFTPLTVYSKLHLQAVLMLLNMTGVPMACVFDREE